MPGRSNQSDHVIKKHPEEGIKKAATEFVTALYQG